MRDLISNWDGLGVVSRFDRETGTWIFIALHDARLGPPSGGTRMRTYAQPEEGLHDAMRLAEGMTLKWAALEMPFGGGKAVLATPGPIEGEARAGLLARYGAVVEALHGGFRTGEDLGTRPDDMQTLSTHTRWVHVYSRNGSATDPGPFTARGVFAGIRAAVAAGLDGSGLDGTSVLVQGAGHVGLPLVGFLLEAGARVMVSDPDDDRRERARALGATEVAVDRVYTTQCDVYAPCAMGATLTEETIQTLRCRIVAGSANNQLGHADDAQRLHERGILYAPDYVINGGGAMTFALLAQGEQDRDAILRRTESVGDRLADIFAQAQRDDRSPADVAQQLALGYLQAHG